MTTAIALIYGGSSVEYYFSSRKDLRRLCDLPRTISADQESDIPWTSDILSQTNISRLNLNPFHCMIEVSAIHGDLEENLSKLTGIIWKYNGTGPTPQLRVKDLALMDIGPI